MQPSLDLAAVDCHYPVAHLVGSTPTFTIPWQRRRKNSFFSAYQAGDYLTGLNPIMVNSLPINQRENLKRSPRISYSMAQLDLAGLTWAHTKECWTWYLQMWLCITERVTGLVLYIGRWFISEEFAPEYWRWKRHTSIIGLYSSSRNLKRILNRRHWRG